MPVRISFKGATGPEIDQFVVTIVDQRIETIFDHLLDLIEGLLT